MTKPFTPPSVHSDRPKIPSGFHVARLYSIVQLGIINDVYKGKPIKNSKVRLTFEFPTVKHKFSDERGLQPLVISKEFIYSKSSTSKHSLRIFAESWRGKSFTNEEWESFDLLKMIGQPAYINIVHSEKYEDIQTIAKLPQSMVCDPQINPSTVFVWSDPNWSVFESQADFIKKKMFNSDEYINIKKSNMELIPRIIIDIEIELSGSDSATPVNKQNEGVTNVSKIYEQHTEDIKFEDDLPF